MTPAAPPADDASGVVGGGAGVGPGWLVEHDLGPGVRAAFTTAARGMAPGFDDDDATVSRHRADLAAWAGGPVAFARQVHGATVHRVEDAPGARGPAGPAAPGPGTAASAWTLARPDGAPIEADAVLARRGAPVGVLVADCVPVLLADAAAGVVAAVHAGRRGVIAGVVPAAVAALAGAGADPGRLRAVVGPAVCGACYEVPADLRDEVAAVVPCASTTSWGTAGLDLRRGVDLQLRAAGVDAVAHLDACTLTDERWFSHRATGADVGRAGAGRRRAGRVAAVVVAG